LILYTAKLVESPMERSFQASLITR
jgi:hypothetical protein